MKTRRLLLYFQLCSGFLGLLGSNAALAQQTGRLWLSGRGGYDTKTWQFRVSGGMRAGKQTKIEVPSCWEQQGFGDYTYGRWYTKKGEKPSTEEGHYSLSFLVPKSWQGKQVEIVFEGVMTDATVVINKQPAGPMHQGGFTAFSYDITDKISFGKKNMLEVVVQKESADKSINAAERKADWWLFGGIYRPVYLRAKPKNNIERATVDARADGTVNIQLLTKAEKGARLRVSCFEVSKARKLENSDYRELETSLDSSNQEIEIPSDSCLLSFNFNNPKLWDPEHPNLYDLRISLINNKGESEHEVTRRIGFRTIEFRRKDGFYLNGTKLLIKGVNRHCFYPETGRTTSYAEDLADVKLIKAMNANAIRSHYPPDAHLLDICDSLGVLYLNELAGWQNAYSTEQGARILKEMVVHDASHPCIFAWSNGNEGGFNYALDSLFAKYDPQGRHVVHAWALWDGVDAHHYPAYQTGVGRLQFGQEVFMPTEFLHAQYDKGGGASLKDFWANWRQSPLFAGGFIWTWVDEGVARRDRGGEIDTDGPNGPDGIVGPHREKEASWFTIREVWSPIQIEPVKVNKDWNGRIIVRNGQLFSNLNECRMTCEFIASPSYRGFEASQLRSFEITLPSAAPGESKAITIPTDFGKADILRLTALDASGDTINIWSWPLKTAEEHFETSKLRDFEVSKPQSLEISKPIIDFDSTTGLLRKITVGGREIPFNNGPVPVGFKMSLKSFEQKGNRWVAHYSGAVDSIVWQLHDNGLLSMEAVLFNDKRGHGFQGSFIEENARAFGFSFDYPESECKGMTWLGRGPYRVWRNRHEGQTFGLWHKDYNNTVTGELPETNNSTLKTQNSKLIYPEFKGYHANIYWATIESGTAPFTVYSETDDLYFRVFTPEEPKHRRDGKPTMEPFPTGDLSFLMDIPPIQSYKPLQQLGPEAMVPTVRINLGDEGLRMKLWFEF